MLWLALHFPLLPLEALPSRQSPSAVVARGRVLACDRAAAEGGVAPGQKLSTALGLSPGLAVFERAVPGEVRALETLACWAGRFTPTVSLRPPAMLLLDIGGCLRLFGGIERIVEAVREGCAGQGWTLAWAVAPTPLAAVWLAQAGSGASAATAAELPALLGALPPAATGWPAELLARIESFGLRRLGELRALPTASLRQRLGSAPVDDLLRAWGELPDRPSAFVFPESFVGRLELPSRVEHAEGLVFAGQRLFAALAGWLAARQLLLRAATLHLAHDDAPDSELALRFGEPVADEARFVRLLREHLGRLKLAAPIEALTLVADETQARPGDSRPLFAVAVAGEGAAACLERLRARLGEASVQRLAASADHRPEGASRLCDEWLDKSAIDALPAAAQAGQRPLWLLPAPQALAERGGQPQWHGALQLLSRGERIESGWWDSGEAGAAGDVRRDYFVGRNPQGQWAWVFRDAQGWFLHGVFG
ncbi:MAG: DNA polymerase Y family protein [Dechloromonas sp.]|nr:DNA polymerase Y family protein [Dechloromonas sp.]